MDSGLEQDGAVRVQGHGAQRHAAQGRDGGRRGRLKDVGLLIFREAVRSVDPFEAVAAALDAEADTWLAGGGRVFVIGAGKASARMAAAVEAKLGGRISRGVVVVKYGHSVPLESVVVVEAGHPVPDEKGVSAAREVLALARQARREDLVMCLISGGGSALLVLPWEGLTLEDKQHATRTMLSGGATIRELNTVRKHLSLVKGGRLAQAAFPARVVSLILSDVVGDPLDVIASGPTVPDPTTFESALAIARRFGVNVPSVLEHLESGAAGLVPETPKPLHPCFRRVSNVIVGSSARALQAAAAEARTRDFHPLILSSFIEGDTREVARLHAAVAREVVATGNPVSRPCCIISGGETTVTVRGGGKGGRCQEFALAFAAHIEGLEGVAALALGTDGTDGPTDAAGAYCDWTTCARARELGLSPSAYLEDNNSYEFFRQLGDLVITGPTRTNVMDLRLVLVD